MTAVISTTSLPRFANVFPNDIIKRLQDLEHVANGNGLAIGVATTIAGDVTGALTSSAIQAIQGVSVSADPLGQYAYTAGRTGGQSLIGGTATTDTLFLAATTAGVPATTSTVDVYAGTRSMIRTRPVGTAAIVFPAGVEIGNVGQGQSSLSQLTQFQATTTASGTYNSGTTYAKGAVVNPTGQPTVFYISLADSNTGNDPLFGSPAAYSGATTYAINTVVTDQGQFFKSLQNSNTNHDPTIAGNQGVWWTRVFSTWWYRLRSNSNIGSFALSNGTAHSLFADTSLVTNLASNKQALNIRFENLPGATGTPATGLQANAVTMAAYNMDPEYQGVIMGEAMYVQQSVDPTGTPPPLFGANWVLITREQATQVMPTTGLELDIQSLATCFGIIPGSIFRAGNSGIQDIATAFLVSSANPSVVSAGGNPLGGNGTFRVGLGIDHGLKLGLSASAYDASRAYEINQLATNGGLTWQSKHSANTGVTPVEGSDWTQYKSTHGPTDYDVWSGAFDATSSLPTGTARWYVDSTGHGFFAGGVNSSGGRSVGAQNISTAAALLGGGFDILNVTNNATDPTTHAAISPLLLNAPTVVGTIANGNDGQVLRLVNAGAKAWTLYDNFQSTGTYHSNLRLNAPTRTLTTGNEIELQYVVALGLWRETGFSAGTGVSSNTLYQTSIMPGLFTYSALATAAAWSPAVVHASGDYTFNYANASPNFMQFDATVRMTQSGGDFVGYSLAPNLRLSSGVTTGATSVGFSDTTQITAVSGAVSVGGWDSFYSNPTVQNLTSGSATFTQTTLAGFYSGATVRNGATLSNHRGHYAAKPVTAGTTTTTVNTVSAIVDNTSNFNPVDSTSYPSALSAAAAGVFSTAMIGASVVDSPTDSFHFVASGTLIAAVSTNGAIAYLDTAANNTSVGGTSDFTGVTITATNTTLGGTLTNAYGFFAEDFTGVASGDSYGIYNEGPTLLGGLQLDNAGKVTAKQTLDGTGAAYNASNILTTDTLPNLIALGGGGRTVNLRSYSNTLGPSFVFESPGGSTGTPLVTPLGSIMGGFYYNGASSVSSTLALRTVASYLVVAEQAVGALSTSGAAGFRWSVGAIGGGAVTLAMALDNAGTLWGAPTITSSVPSSGNWSLTQGGNLSLLGTLTQGSSGQFVVNALGQITALGTILASPTFGTTSGAIISAYRDNTTPMVAGNTLASILLKGAGDNAHTIQNGIDIRGVAEATWTLTGGAGSTPTSGARFEILTTKTTSTALNIVGTWDNAGTYHHAPTIASNLVSASTFAIKADGSTWFAPSVYSSNQPSAAPATIDASGNGAFATVSLSQPTIDTPVVTTSTVATNDDPTEKVVQGRGTTTSNTALTLNTIAIASSTVVIITSYVYGRRTGGTNVTGATGDGMCDVIVGTFRNVGGTVTQIGATASLALMKDTEFAATPAAFAISGTNVLVQATGSLLTNVTWHSVSRYCPVGT